MRHSYGVTDRTDRLARSAASLLLILAAISLTAAWQLHQRNEQHLATVQGDNPADLQLVPRPVPPADAASTVPEPDLSITPTHLYVQAIKVDTLVDAKPTHRTRDPFLHRTVDSFGVPDDMYTTTWWSSGPAPGASGMAVVLGHTQVGGYGVFNRLGALEPGAGVTLTGDGQALNFTVLRVRTGISKTDPYALRDALEHRPPGARLALITCSGTFDTTYDQSTENTVAFASLVP